jgi:hypothetical protein
MTYHEDMCRIEDKGTLVINMNVGSIVAFAYRAKLRALAV